MPLYEYKCDQCGDVFEVIEKFSDAPLEHHAGCGGHVERLLSVSALQFKGTGWYVTDYARKSGNGTTASGSDKGAKESSGKKESTDSSASKSESKSDTAKPSPSTSQAEKK